MLLLPTFLELVKRPEFRHFDSWYHFLLHCKIFVSQDLQVYFVSPHLLFWQCWQVGIIFLAIAKMVKNGQKRNCSEILLIFGVFIKKRWNPSIVRPIIIMVNRKSKGTRCLYSLLTLQYSWKKKYTYINKWFSMICIVYVLSNPFLKWPKHALHEASFNLGLLNYNE